VTKAKILYRYIFTELLSPFALGLLVFTFILLMNRILKLMDLIINKGMGIGEVVLLLFYMLPSFLIITIPMAILLAILIALGRLSSDSEIIAMKASGISLYQLLPPFAVFCVAGFLFTNLITLYLLPKGNHAFRTHILDLAQQHSEASLEPGVFNDYIDGMVIYIDGFDIKQKRIKGVLVSDRRDPKLPVLISGQEGIILSGHDNRGILLKLFNGSIHSYDKNTHSYQYAVFKTYDMKVRMEGSQEARKLKRREMGVGSLWQLSNEKIAQGKRDARIGVEIHKRFAFPFGCLVFGILGVPLGVFWRRGGKAYGFVLSIIIVFLYYIVLNIGESMAKSGYLFAFMGMWLPNILLGGLGVYLFRKVAREEQWFMEILASELIMPVFQGIRETFAGKSTGFSKKPKQGLLWLTSGAQTIKQQFFQRLAEVRRRSPYGDLVDFDREQQNQNGQQDKQPLLPFLNEEKEQEVVLYRGNTASKVFHKPQCKQYNSKNCTEVFTSRQEAKKAGFRPCRQCRP